MILFNQAVEQRFIRRAPDLRQRADVTDSGKPKVKSGTIRSFGVLTKPSPASPFSDSFSTTNVLPGADDLCLTVPTLEMCETLLSRFGEPPNPLANSVFPGYAGLTKE